MAKTTKLPEESRVSGQKLMALLEVPYEDETLSLVEAFDKAVERCAKTARRHDGKATLKLEITFAPKSGKLKVRPSLRMKLPEPEAIAVPLFTDRLGLLHDEDPEQKKLDFPRPTTADGKSE